MQASTVYSLHKTNERTIGFKKPFIFEFGLRQCLLSFCRSFVLLSDKIFKLVAISKVRSFDRRQRVNEKGLKKIDRNSPSMNSQSLKQGRVAIRIVSDAKNLSFNSLRVQHSKSLCNCASNLSFFLSSLFE